MVNNSITLFKSLLFAASNIWFLIRLAKPISINVFIGSDEGIEFKLGFGEEISSIWSNKLLLFVGLVLNVLTNAVCWSWIDEIG